MPIPLITLESLKADVKAILARIAQFEQQPKLDFPLAIQAPSLQDGQTYLGLIASADGTRAHHLILLPDQAKNLTWQAAMDWAKSIGGELPDRVESALLFAHAKDKFQPEYYWTREQHQDPAYAWSQYFGNGTQYYARPSDEFRACAVRRLPI